MSEEIRYQINGQLADNTVTVDNKEDMILVPVSNGSPLSPAGRPFQR